MVLRGLLLIYVLVVACPIRFWNLEPSVDNAWTFALNYAAAHGLQGLTWTTGPLGHLMFPQDLSDNLAHALVFQMILWLVLTLVFVDLFFLAGFRLRNLAAFSVFFGLSAPWYWFNYEGLENLVVAAILVLLVVARWRGGMARYLGALVLTGLVWLLTLPAVMLAGGAVAGYLAEALYRRRPKALRDLALAAIIPAIVAMAAGLTILGSLPSLMRFVKGSLETTGNYSVAMSTQGDGIEFAGALETAIWVGALLYVATKANRRIGPFTVGLLAIPLFLSFKRGFVRQDMHIVTFFGFAALTLALIALMMSIEGPRIAAVSLILLAFGIVWLEYNVQRFGSAEAFSEATGRLPMRFAYHALVRRDVRAFLRTVSEASFTTDTRLEPEILSVVGKSPVATMEIIFSSAPLDGLNLQVYPVVQRYGAYSPYLDGLNATWLRDERLRYLIADWYAIDHRQPWAETPAMWLEVYRWYDTRLLGKRNLLLERRTAPRFERLAPIANFEARVSDGLEIPESETPVFWSLRCHPTTIGSLQKLLFRVPEVLMTADRGAPWRVIPEVLTSPVMGNFLPDNLDELAALMTPSVPHKAPVKKLYFGGPGLKAYAPVCQAALWSPQ